MRTTARITVRLAAAALALAPLARTHELKDVSLIASGGKTHLKLAFSADAGEPEFPLFFQKGDAGKGTLTLSFLETTTAFPLGRHGLDVNAPQLEDITLKKVTSPSGKNFLGIELKLRDAASQILADGEAEVENAPKGVLKVQLGQATVPKYEWSLAKAMQAGDAYLSAKAAPAPKVKKSKTAKAEAAAERETAEAFSAPVPAEPAAKAPPADTGLSAPVMTVPATTDSQPTARKARVAKVPAKPAAANPIDNPAVDGKTASPASAKSAGTSAAPALTPPEEAPDPVTSAHADGMAFEKTHAPAGNGNGNGNAGKAKGGLSSSRIFVLGKGGKILVILKDSVALKSEPGVQGKVIRKIPIGEKAERIESKWGKVRVAVGQDTGWLPASETVYDDEMTPVQEKSIHDKLASNQARLEAAQAKLAAAQAKEEEKKRKADEAKRKAEEATAAAAAEAQRKLAEKQAAQDAKKLAQAAASAAAAAAHPPAGIQEAGAAPNRAGQPGTAPSPAQPAAAGSQAKAQTTPKLGLADNPELANKLAQEKLAAEEEKKRIEPEENRVTYNSYGRRDPFIPVEQGAADNGIDIDQMKVVGIIWASQPMAVLEHSREAGVSFTVKEGDPVHNGRVARISHDAVTFDISEYGISRSYSLRLVSNAKEGAKK